jgi:hypothetical protein
MESSLRVAHSRDKANLLKPDDSILILAAFLLKNKASNFRRSQIPRFTKLF